MGIGFSDNVIYSRQVFVRAMLETPLRMLLHMDEGFVRDPASGQPMRRQDNGWLFDVAGDGFEATFGIELEQIPETGEPSPYTG